MRCLLSPSRAGLRRCCLSFIRLVSLELRVFAWLRVCSLCLFLFCCFPSRKRQKKGGVKNVPGSPSIYLYLPGRPSLCSSSSGRASTERAFLLLLFPARPCDVVVFCALQEAFHPPPVCVLLLFPGLSYPPLGARRAQQRRTARDRRLLVSSAAVERSNFLLQRFTTRFSALIMILFCFSSPLHVRLRSFFFFFVLTSPPSGTCPLAAIAAVGRSPAFILMGAAFFLFCFLANC